MTKCRATECQFTFGLILALVLVLGIVQWSFLPILIENAPLTGRAVLEVSSSHTSKFAAPFKCFLADRLQPRLSQSRPSLPGIAPTFLHQPEESVPGWNDVFFSHLQLRAPPSA
jgi:hypothetical protein